MFTLITLLSILAGQSLGVIYHLNESEYTVIPAVNVWEDPAGCARYCIAELHLKPSEGYPGNTVREYSAHRPTHFNHLRVRRGVCASRCALPLHQCASAAIHPAMQPQIDQMFCTEDMEISFDSWDLTVTTTILLLLGLVALSTHIARKSKARDYPNKFLSCFSLQQNWDKLYKQEDNSNLNTPDLKCFNGIRMLCLAGVAVAHTFIGFCLRVRNDRDLEEGYIWLRYGTGVVMAVQMFIVLSGFLMAYNLQKELDSGCESSLTTIRKKILKRWLRLTPLYACSLAFSTSLFRFFGFGPLFMHIAQSEIRECRRDWWVNILYLINYVDYSKCKTESWSLAADFHMSVIGIAMVVLLSGRKRMWALITLVLVGVVSSAAHTYFQDLDPWFIASPETLKREVFGDPTFDHVYKRTHTNLASYAMGLAAGLFVWHINKTGRKPLQYQKYRFTFWVCIAGMCLLVCVNGAWYRDAPRDSLHLRTFAAATYKLSFACLCALSLVILSLRVEDSCRRLLGLDIWTPLARVTYAAYIVHIMLLKSLGSLQLTVNFSLLNTMFSTLAVIALELALGHVAYLFVEAPIQNVVQRYILDKMEDRNKDSVKQLKSQ